MANGPTKSRLVAITIWVVMLAAAWSLPVLTLVAREQEREAMAGYYKPGKPAEFYAQQQLDAPVPPATPSRGG